MCFVAQFTGSPQRFAKSNTQTSLGLCLLMVHNATSCQDRAKTVLSVLRDQGFACVLSIVHLGAVVFSLCVQFLILSSGSMHSNHFDFVPDRDQTS